MKKKYYDCHDEFIWWKMTRSAEVAKESDVHVKLIGGVDMLTWKYVSSKEWVGGISGKLIVSSNMAFASEVSEKGMTIDKGESICLKRSALVEWHVWTQK